MYLSVSNNIHPLSEQSLLLVISGAFCARSGLQGFHVTFSTTESCRDALIFSSTTGLTQRDSMTRRKDVCGYNRPVKFLYLGFFVLEIHKEVVRGVAAGLKIS